MGYLKTKDSELLFQGGLQHRSDNICFNKLQVPMTLFEHFTSISMLHTSGTRDVVRYVASISMIHNSGTVHDVRCFTSKSMLHTSDTLYVERCFYLYIYVTYFRYPVYDALLVYICCILQVPVTLFGVFPVTEVYKDGTLMMTLGQNTVSIFHTVNSSQRLKGKITSHWQWLIAER